MGKTRTSVGRLSAIAFAIVVASYALAAPVLATGGVALQAASANGNSDNAPGQNKADGSWNGEAGQDYATAMALIILQMPNRYLPVFHGKGPGG